MNTIRFVEIPRADCRVVGTNVMLTLVVSKVFFPRIVFYVEFPLFNCICNPKKLISIDPERSFDGVVRNTDSSRIIAVHYCWSCGCPISSSVSQKMVACLQCN